MNRPPGAADEHTIHAHNEPVPPRRPVRAVGTAAAVTPRIADEFFYMAHDDQTGRPRLFDTALSSGLAAALLVELYYERRITFEHGKVDVLQRFPPKDWLQHLVLDQLIAQPQHTDTRTWLAFLATTAYEQVATRMWQVGLLQQTQVSRLWRQRTVYVPTDINTAAWSWARLSQQVRNYRQLDHFDIALAGLTLHTQLDTALLDGAPYSAHAHLRQLVNQSWLPLRDLLADLSSVIGAGVLSHRTS
ncbi:GPP34 family phosphoprotein [Micromonospora arida]|uniref:GPP34 family phosphoprotein n=1 Tax=Micromonospora arida TaxID=2203715 RepID=A0A3N9XIA8_9ACTN|nr:GPP34 family phosphoprotein [Micromonospora arida]